MVGAGTPAATLSTDSTGKAVYTRNIPTQVSTGQWGQHQVSFRHGSLENRTGYVVYTSNGVLSGEVRDATSGTPLKGLRVGISREDTDLLAFTDAAGRYRFDGLKVDGVEYLLTAVLNTYVTRTVSLPI
ncbi:MAG: carboxypeptidase-like regulatory domain-containing protein [Bacillota bacterium]